MQGDGFAEVYASGAGGAAFAAAAAGRVGFRGAVAAGGRIGGRRYGFAAGAAGVLCGSGGRPVGKVPVCIIDSCAHIKLFPFLCRGENAAWGCYII